MSLDVALLSHFGDAITELSNISQWAEVGDTVDDIVAACKASVESWYSDMLIGSVTSWLSTSPDGWLLLDGSTHAEADYPELFAVLDDVLKSGSNFTLPDVANSFTYGVNAVADAGIVTGTNLLNLTIGQLPAHTHTYTPPVIGADVGGAGPPLPSAVVGGATDTGSVGDGDDIDIRPKRVGLVYAVFAGRT
jgi:hypothetical protein